MLPTNTAIAQLLRQQASDLARRGDNLYRVRAFRQAAMAMLTLREELATLIAVQGWSALEEIPGIGRSLARTITSFLESPSAAPPVS